MLDYRAHKLFWLLNLPLRIIARLIFWGVVLGAIIFVGSLGYNPLLKILIAYGLVEGTGIVTMILFAFIDSIVSRLFFWIVDVIPSKGDDEEEAKVIVKGGRLVWLAKKLNNEIENWTDRDTEEFYSALNWRARWLFKTREKVWKRIEIFRGEFYRTGREPGDLSRSEIQTLVGFLEGSKFDQAVQTVIINQMFFNSILALTTIVIAVMMQQR